MPPPQYNRFQFFVRLTDEKHTGPISFKADLALLRQIQKLVASPRIPAYETASDFLRDAVYHRLHDIHEYLQQNNLPTDDVEETLVQLDFLQELARQQALRLRYGKAADEMVATITVLMQGGASGRDEARKYLISCRDRINRIPIQHWRERCLTVLAPFADGLGLGKKFSLHPSQHNREQEDDAAN